MNTLGKDFKAAFGSVWALIGVLVSSVAVFNWLSGVLKIGLSALFHQLLTAFRGVFHPIIEFLTGWAIPWLPFLALPEWKDGLVLWFAVGGAVARTFSNLTFRLNLSQSRFVNGPLDVFFRSHWLWPMGLIFSFVLWPLMLVFFCAHPIVHRDEFGYITERTLKENTSFGKNYDHDLRIVFAMQLAAVISVVVCLVLLNASGAG